MGCHSVVSCELLYTVLSYYDVSTDGLQDKGIAANEATGQ